MAAAVPKTQKKVAKAEEEDEDDVSDLSDIEDDAGSDEEEKDPGLTNLEVVTKYKLAGDMANRVVKKVADAAVEGATTIALCKLGDELIAQETALVYNKKIKGKAVSKGVGFPTCVSVNNVVCHNCPLDSDPVVTLAAGDVVKIDLGVQLGGYLGLVASTVIVGASKESPVTGAKADAVLACHYAIEAALRLLRPGANTADVTKAVQKIAEDFGCKPVEGMLCHQLGRNVIDGEKAIIINPSDQQKKDHKESEIAVNEVYALDIIISSGEGKAKLAEARTTVLKKTDATYQLKMRNSRAFLGEVSKKFGTFPFTLRSCEDEKKARMALVECTKHGVLQPYDILLEKDGAFVVQCKMQVLLLPTGTVRVTLGSLPVERVRSEHKVSDPALVALINSSLSGKKKKGGKKKAAATGEAGAAGAAEEGDAE